MRKMLMLLAVMVPVGVGCGGEGLPDAANDAEPVAGGEDVDAQIAELTVVLDIEAAPGVTGHLHSYAFELTRCPEPLGWLKWLNPFPSAYASHPLDLTANDILIWHTPLSLTQSDAFSKTQTVERGEICGATWLFAHGGVTFEDELASLLIRRDGQELARSHYASEVVLVFEEPLVFESDQTVNLRLDVASWVETFDGASSGALGARDAWLSLGAALTPSSE